MGLVGAILTRLAPRRAVVGDLSTHSRRVLSRFDSAQTTPENSRHWAPANGDAADVEASPWVRQTIRNRARHEVANNGYAAGILDTLANDTIGTGPRLQVLHKDKDLCRRVELEFAAWSEAVFLAEKLRTMRIARAQDGEAFCVLVTNPGLDSLVQLDLSLVECDRVTSRLTALNVTDREIDGITFDEYGNPTSYRVLKHHPGGNMTAIDDADQIPAKDMLHIFRRRRPGLHRGVSELYPVLDLFAKLRRYITAVLGAAETAADFAAVIQTNAPAEGEAAKTTPMKVVELEPRMATVLPEGWGLGQLKAEQPTTAFAEFKAEILSEIARPFSMPYNVAACNSKNYNYASGRLDHKGYGKSIHIDQVLYQGIRIMSPIVRRWLPEYARATNDRQALEICHWQWFWDGFEHADPDKEAKATERRLLNWTTNRSIEYAKQNRDWEEEVRQSAREEVAIEVARREARKAAGLPEEPVLQED